MPEAHQEDFRHLLKWLQTPDDDVPMPPLPVGLFFGSIGDGPRVATFTLLKRKPKERATALHGVHRQDRLPLLSDRPEIGRHE